MRSYLLRSAVVCLLFAVIACDASRPPAAVAPPPVAAAVGIAVLEDKSGSANSTRTPRCTMAHIDRLIAIVRERSGELAYGWVAKDSNNVLRRLTIEPGPVAPAKPAQDMNPFQLREQMRAYRAAHAAFAAKQQAWTDDAEQKIAAFKEEVGPLLEQTPNAPRSDVFGAIERADLFLAEATPGTGRTAMILLISDAQDNVHREFPGLRSHAELLLVNGIGSIGSLATLQPAPQRFEAIEPAIRYIEVNP